MIDRLKEFRTKGKQLGFVPHAYEDSYDEEKLTEDRKIVSTFLPMTKKNISKLLEMHENNKTILDLKIKQQDEVRGNNEREISQELTNCIRQNQSLQISVRDSLNEMRTEVAKARTEYEDEPESRVIVGIYSALMVRFREILREFQECQLEYRTAAQKKIKRQIEIVKPDADEEEINELVNDPDATSKLLNEQITGTAHQKIRNAVDDIERKYQDILRLEKGVEEVYQLFLDLGTLIQAQGEMLDSILTNMHEARDYVKKANVHFHTAREVHKKTRTKMC